MSSSPLPIRIREQIDKRCDQFEQLWRAGKTPELRDFLSGVEEIGQEQLLSELIAIELYYRQMRGEAMSDEVLIDQHIAGALLRLRSAVNVEHRQSSGDQQQFRDVLAALVAAVERRDASQQQELVDRHPKFAAELTTFLAACKRVDELVAAPPSAIQSADAVHHARSDDATLRAEQSVAADALVGTRVRYFGDYELLKEIGRGGMGIVYKAHQVNLKRIVAVKMLMAGDLAAEHDVRRFYAEAEAVAKLDHPGIVPIFEVGEHGGEHYFSMGYVEGQSLAQKVAAGPLPPREAAKLTKKIAEAVAYAHKHGVIHRDLKPANVLLDKNGQPRVTDFGLAKRVEADSELTAKGQVLGTPSYMPPEQAAGRLDQIKETADIYSLGAILYALLTGRPPFLAASTVDTLIQVLEKEPISAQLLNSEVDRDLDTICAKCLAKQLDARYASAQDLADELARFLNGTPIRARPISAVTQVRRWCKRNPIPAALAGAILGLLFVAAGVSYYMAIKQSAYAQDIADRGVLNFSIFAERNSSLSLSYMPISDSALAYLDEPFTHLSKLDLSSTRITDRGLKHLGMLKNLQELSLVDTDVTDAGLKHLRQLSSLRRVTIAGTHVTDSGIADLREALPQTEIIWRPNTSKLLFWLTNLVLASCVAWTLAHGLYDCLGRGKQLTRIRSARTLKGRHGMAWALAGLIVVPFIGLVVESIRLPFYQTPYGGAVTFALLLVFGILTAVFALIRGDGWVVYEKGVHCGLAGFRKWGRIDRFEWCDDELVLHLTRSPPKKILVSNDLKQTIDDVLRQFRRAPKLTGETTPMLGDFHIHLAKITLTTRE